METAIFTAIVQKLKVDVPEVKFIDLDSGQLDMMAESYPFSFPAVFIDFPDIDWKDMSKGVQNGTVLVNVRIAQRVIEDTHSLAPATSVSTAIEKLKTKSKIHLSINRLSGEHFNRLVRTRTGTEKRSDGLKVWNITYMCGLLDPGTLPDWDEVMVALNIQKENA